MRKARVTAKWIKESFRKRLSVGYCDMQFLLRYENALYYICGSLGWNSDNYYFPEFDLLISTGYRPVMGTIKTDYNIVRNYNDMAMKIIDDNSPDIISYEQKEIEIEKILHEFLQEVIK